MLEIAPGVAREAVAAYNRGSYRGRRNVDVDRIAYSRFRSGLPADQARLTELIRFVGEDYGGAQSRFLPHGFRVESATIAANLLTVQELWTARLAATVPLRERAPTSEVLTDLVAPFVATKRWTVWASKTLHFLRPDVFPILDSRAEKALGVTLGRTAKDYERYCSLFRDVLVSNGAAMAAGKAADMGQSASDLKLLDKILYQLGNPS